MTGQTFVLVHGAWHGGWCWKEVARRLRSDGHAVTTPTLSGLGARAHLLGPHINFETHVTDIVNHITFEDLTDVVLAGHSYAGTLITHVADRIAGRLRRLIYLDAQIAEDGASIMDALTPEIRAERRAAAQKDGLAMAAPGPAALGVRDPEVAAWMAPRLTPHPIATYEQKGHLSHPQGAGLPCDFILCTDPPFPSIKPFAERARGLGWPIHELATGHDAMLSAPAETAELLARLGGQ